MSLCGEVASSGTTHDYRRDFLSLVMSSLQVKRSEQLRTKGNDILTAYTTPSSSNIAVER